MTMITKLLGHAILCTQNKTKAMCEIVASLDPDIEIREDCETVDFAYCRIRAHFINGSLTSHPYCDEQFSDGVRSFLIMHSIPANVGWSESGMQTSEYGDFDCDYDTIEAIFPEEFRKARADKKAARPAALVKGKVEYTVELMSLRVEVKDAIGTVVDTFETDNNVTPPLPLVGDHSMTSIALEQATELANKYQIKEIRQVNG